MYLRLAILLCMPASCFAVKTNYQKRIDTLHSIMKELNAQHIRKRVRIQHGKYPIDLLISASQYIAIAQELKENTIIGDPKPQKDLAIEQIDSFIKETKSILK